MVILGMMPHTCHSQPRIATLPSPIRHSLQRSDKIDIVYNNDETLLRLLTLFLPPCLLKGGRPTVHLQEEAEKEKGKKREKWTEMER
jgi:hypothetical protein